MEKGARLNSYKTALRCIRKNMSDEMIAEITGLNSETTAKLRNLLNQYGEDAGLHLEKV
jgi:hypothetical protein